MFEYIDVDKFDELPKPKPGTRFLDFLGGTKSLRCFVVPEELPRGLFLEENESLLDRCLHPIYKNKGICVRQDPSYPVPGFYIVSTSAHFNSIDHVDPVLNLRIFFTIHTIRKAMRNVLGFNHVNIIYQEKLHKSSDVHYWLLPMHDLTPSQRILNTDLQSYLNSFNFHQEKSYILKLNSSLRDFLKNTNFLEQDNILLEKISYLNN
jgi:diadenosine tetraphosphate (Ap4A) HIT family hydrolase